MRQRSQNSCSTSAPGAFIVGTKDSKVVPWLPVLFFRTLIRDFELQHGEDLLSRHASQQQICSRWASIFSYDGRSAAGRSPVLRGRPAADLRGASTSSRSSTIRKGALCGARRPLAHVCACSHRLRVPRTCLGPAPSAPTQGRPLATTSAFFLAPAPTLRPLAPTPLFTSSVYGKPCRLRALPFFPGDFATHVPDFSCTEGAC